MASGPGTLLREQDVPLEGVRLHCTVGGSGSAVVLLHGYAQTSHMWRPVLAALAARHTVIVPDLRGAGLSQRTEGGYDKVGLARDVRALLSALGHERAAVAGHDIGMMVAYAFAAQYPEATSRLALLDAFLPGIGNWKDMWLLRDLWHFHFHGKTPLALVDGRERTYFEHFWNDFAADPAHSVPEADRQLYAAAYARDGGMRAGFEYFKAFERDAQDFARLARTKLAMPVLVIAGEKSGGTFLVEQVKLAANDVRGEVIAGSGHWLMEEAPERVIPLLLPFLDGEGQAS